jgi:NAD(P)-dependent dehydrogenase (short-subunit alcohol dehydrogenase family)
VRTGAPHRAVAYRTGILSGRLEIVNSRPIAVVTGGSRGIGAATSILLAEQGYDVALTYRTETDVAETVAAACRSAGARAITIQVDVGEPDQIPGLFATVDQELGTLSALINNAGVVDQLARVDQISAARLTRMFAINVVGTFLCAGEAVRRMSTKHGGVGGVIVNVGSAAARLGSPGEYVDYASSKAAIDTMTLGLSKEVAAEGIRVNCVRPGIVETEIHASGGQPNRAAEKAPLIPMLRPGQSYEIASAIAWFCSPGATYATGALLDVSGGR